MGVGYIFSCQEFNICLDRIVESYFFGDCRKLNRRKSMVHSEWNGIDSHGDSARIRFLGR